MWSMTALPNANRAKYVPTHCVIISSTNHFYDSWKYGKTFQRIVGSFDLCGIHSQSSILLDALTLYICKRQRTSGMRKDIVSDAKVRLIKMSIEHKSCAYKHVIIRIYTYIDTKHIMNRIEYIKMWTVNIRRPHDVASFSSDLTFEKCSTKWHWWHNCWCIGG